MEIILDELVQYTEKKINLFDYCELHYSDIVDRKFCIVKYINKNIEKICLYQVLGNYIDNLDFTRGSVIYLFEIDFNFNKLDYIIGNIRNNILLNASNKFRKITIIQKNFIEIKNHYNFNVREKSINSNDIIKTIYI